MGAGRTEFELKFTGPPGELAKLPQSRFFAAVAPEGGSWERLTSTYYDTPDGALAARGLSLRLREEGADYIQAVKVKCDNPAARTEYETDIDCASSFPAQTGNAGIDRAVREAAVALTPIAGTSVDRWAAIIRYKNAEIEIAVDLGRAESCDQTGRIFTGPLAEVELELISGETAAVFDFARLLLDNAPLQLSAGTKLEIAMQLQKTAPPIPKLKRLDAGAEKTAADVLAASLSDCAARLAALQAPVTEMRRPEGIHQMRVALRRLRAIERIFRSYVKSGEIARLAGEAKRIASALGPARDWDVFIAETLTVAVESDYAPAGLRLLKAKAETERASAWSGAVEAVSGHEFTHLLLGLMEAGTLQRWRENGSKALDRQAIDFAPRALNRALKKVVKAAATDDGVRDPASLHPLRIALKKLRYPLQLFKGLYPKKARREYMAALSGLQNALGVMNDSVIAQDLSDRATEGGGEGVMRAAGFISGYKAAEAQSAVKEIDAAFAAFEKMTPFWRD